MKRLANRFLRFLVVATMFVLSIAVLPSGVLAQDGKLGNEFDYYSDDTFSCQVGIAIYCNGYTYRSGQQTEFVIVTQVC